MKNIPKVAGNDISAARNMSIRSDNECSQIISKDNEKHRKFKFNIGKTADADKNPLFF